MLLQSLLRGAVARWEVIGRLATTSAMRRTYLHNLFPTITMARLPTELVIQIQGYMSTKELKVIGLVSSEYCSWVPPLLFRRVRPWSFGARSQDISGSISCLQNNFRLSSAVGVLDAAIIRINQHPAADLQRIMEFIE